jgi:hypothetical protein
MRTLIINMLVAALLLFGASSASAFAINHVTNYNPLTSGSNNNGELEVSDTVTIHVFLDTEGAGVATPIGNPGVNLMTVGIIYSAPQLEFSGANAGGTYAYLNYYYPPYNYPPYITSTYNGSQSTYLLFTFPQPSTGAFSQPGSVYMVPQQTPWQTWPTPPGELVPSPFCPSPGTCEQVNLNWVPPGIVPDLTAQVRGSTNTWIGSIVLHVRALDPDNAVAGLFIDGSCCILRTADGTDHASTTTVDAPTTINLPEPTIALLLGFGLLGLGLAGRRQG